MKIFFHRDMFIILSGQVEVQDKNHKSILFLTGGDIIGELSGLEKPRRLVTALVRSEDAYAIHLNKKELKQVFKLFPSFYGTVYHKIKKLEANLA
ncbi:MAG: cyclic nucleotide-binding domain-containing protein [Nitrospinae bacterium]|nr:cyclic nucleotide-binding domain-containing protein [Nitrospinota bacterium]